MTHVSKLFVALAATAALTIGARSALAQHEHGSDPAAKHTDQPAHGKAEKSGRVGDPYPFDTCPISGKKLGAMGDPVVKVYDGREVRFCCDMCPPKFEKDLAANLAKLDEKTIKDQAPLYPLKTSLVTGKDLPAKPYEFIYGNRLIRLGAESERADFLKDPKKYMSDLDKAVVAAQMKDYPLTTCMVSKDKLGGDMGEPMEYVIAGRLIRSCCKDCKKDLEKDPAKFIAMIDEARKAKNPQAPADDHDKAHDHKHGG